VGTAAVAGDVMASVGMTAIRGGIIGGVALATLMNRMGGDVSLDANGKVVSSATSPNAGDVGFNGHLWAVGEANNGWSYWNSASAACQHIADENNPNSGGFYYSYSGVQMYASGNAQCSFSVSDHRGWTGSDGTGVGYVGSCVSGYVASGGDCVPDPSAPRQLATDAQIQNAIKAHPDTWPSIYNDMNCGPTLALTNGSTSDPCYGLYSDSRTGFGVSFSTGGSSWTNNGCAVSSATCPSATVTTGPTTDSQTKTNADGSKTTTNTTTTKTTTVSGTNDRTNPVSSQTTTTTTTSTTVTNPDGSTTTTNETVTDQAPPQTGTNANQQQKDQTQPTTATFQSPELKLYTPKDKTFAQVFQGFVSRVQGMPWYSSITGFFNVTIGGGSCPHWAVPASRWNGPLDLTPYLCGGSMPGLFAMAGAIVLAVAAWAAVKIAFL